MLINMVALWVFGMLAVSFLTASNQPFGTSFAGCEHKVAVSLRENLSFSCHCVLIQDTDAIVKNHYLTCLDDSLSPPVTLPVSSLSNPFLFLSSSLVNMRSYSTLKTT